MIKKNRIGGNQRKSRKNKLDRLVEKNIKATIKLFFEDREIIPLTSRLGVENGYVLKDFYGIHVPIKDVKFEGYVSFGIKVQKGGYIEQQLKDAGVLK